MDTKKVKKTYSDYSDSHGDHGKRVGPDVLSVEERLDQLESWKKSKQGCHMGQIQMEG